MAQRKIVLCEYTCPICGSTKLLPLLRDGFHYCACLGEGFGETRMQETAVMRAVDAVLPRRVG